MQGIALLGLVFLVSIAIALALQRQMRLGEIQTYPLPAHLSTRLAETYAQLSDQDRERVLQGLRDFFAISVMARGRPVAMPSRAVDVAWHEFILSTRAYQAFCAKALGRFLHHTPAEAMESPQRAQQGIQRAWRLACRREGINPAAPKRLPLLFALDAQLSIPNGFVYTLDCLREQGFCASHIGGGCGSSGGDGCGGDGGGCGGD